jgi:hypothetical protein
LLRHVETFFLVLRPKARLRTRIFISCFNVSIFSIFHCGIAPTGFSTTAVGTTLQPENARLCTVTHGLEFS